MTATILLPNDPTTWPPPRPNSTDAWLRQRFWMFWMIGWVIQHRDDPRPAWRFVARNLANGFTFMRGVAAGVVNFGLYLAFVALHLRITLINNLMVLMLVAALVMVCFSDSIDGCLSHASGTISVIGGIADPIMDKVLVGISLYTAWHVASLTGMAKLLFAFGLIAACLVAPDIASAVVTIGEELRARYIGTYHAHSGEFGKHKMYAQCVGVMVVLFGLWLFLDGLEVAVTLSVGGMAVLLYAIYCAFRSIWSHWRKLTGGQRADHWYDLAAAVVALAIGGGLYLLCNPLSQVSWMAPVAVAVISASVGFWAPIWIRFVRLKRAATT